MSSCAPAQRRPLSGCADRPDHRRVRGRRPRASSSGRPGACMTPSRVMWLMTTTRIDDLFVIAEPRGPRGGTRGMTSAMDQTERSPELAAFDRLVGEWTFEATHPMVPSTVVHGHMTFEWLEGERFLVQRSSNDHPDFPDSISVIGFADEEELTAHYYDSRGVFRIYRIAMEGDTLRMWRDEPGFSQRMEGTLSRGWRDAPPGRGSCRATTRRGTTTSRSSTCARRASGSRRDSDIGGACARSGSRPERPRPRRDRRRSPRPAS